MTLSLRLRRMTSGFTVSTVQCARFSSACGAIRGSDGEHFTWFKLFKERATQHVYLSTKKRCERNPRFGGKILGFMSWSEKQKRKVLGNGESYSYTCVDLASLDFAKTYTSEAELAHPFQKWED